MDVEPDPGLVERIAQAGGGEVIPSAADALTTLSSAASTRYPLTLAVSRRIRSASLATRNIRATSLAFPHPHVSADQDADMLGVRDCVRSLIIPLHVPSLCYALRPATV